MFALDELDGSPAANRENYRFELDYFVDVLPKGSSALQVGSMDGLQILRLLRRRPDLTVAGLEIGTELVALAEKNVRQAGRDIWFVRGDITDFRLDVGRFDSVVCVNNTLGYVFDYRFTRPEVESWHGRVLETPGLSTRTHLTRSSRRDGVGNTLTVHVSGQVGDGGAVGRSWRVRTWFV